MHHWENYDYKGYDIAYDDVSGVEEYCDGCIDTQGCHAWTFSSDQWGDVRCYYKVLTVVGLHSGLELG